MIFRRRSTRRPRRASAAAIVRKARRSGGGATGVQAVLIRIRAIGSRKKIGPSAHGPKRIPRRSATATSRATPHRASAIAAIGPGAESLAKSQMGRAVTGRGATSRRARRRVGIGRGGTSRPAKASGRGVESLREGAASTPPSLASANPGTTSLRAVHRRAIGRGRPSRRGRAPRGSRGWASRMPRTASALRSRVASDRGGISRLVVHRGPTRRRAAHHAAIGRGQTSRGGSRRVIGRGAASRRLAAVVSVRGAASRAIRIASRSRRAVRARVEHPATARRASGVTMIRIGTERHDGQPRRVDEAATRSAASR